MASLPGSPGRRHARVSRRPSATLPVPASAPCSPVRPEAVQINMPVNSGAAAAWAGYVKEICNKGDHLRVRVELAGRREIIVEAPAAQHKHRFDTGDAVHIGIIRAVAGAGARRSAAPEQPFPTHAPFRTPRQTPIRRIPQRPSPARKSARSPLSAPPCLCSPLPRTPTCSFPSAAATRRRRSRRLHEPYTKATGGKIVQGEYNGEQAKIKAMVEAGTSRGTLSRSNRPNWRAAARKASTSST